jgi:hypothetical protein
VASLVLSTPDGTRQRIKIFQTLNMANCEDWAAAVNAQEAAAVAMKQEETEQALDERFDQEQMEMAATTALRMIGFLIISQVPGEVLATACWSQSLITFDERLALTTGFGLMELLVERVVRYPTMRRLARALIACERRDLAQQLLFNFHNAYRHRGQCTL